jgi:hypothetical protein
VSAISAMSLGRQPALASKLWMEGASDWAHRWLADKSRESSVLASSATATLPLFPLVSMARIRMAAKIVYRGANYNEMANRLSTGTVAAVGSA